MAEFAPTVERVAERSFLVVAMDAEGSAAIRDAKLDGHLQYIEKNCDRYLAAGPMSNPDDSALVGSFFLVVAASPEEVRDFLDGDPYVASGMYASLTVHEVTPAAGRWMGGVIWESADAIRDRAS